MKTLNIVIGGMSCQHCVKAVTDHLAALEKVRVHDVTVGTAKVSYEEGAMTPERISAAIEEAGFSILGMS